jgi:hypothetical protein
VSDFFGWVVEMLMGCLGCGPTSLNAAMRKLVADQIDIGKVWRGDMSGAIKLGMSVAYQGCARC